MVDSRRRERQNIVFKTDHVASNNFKILKFPLSFVSVLMRLQNNANTCMKDEKYDGSAQPNKNEILFA